MKLIVLEVIAPNLGDKLKFNPASPCVKVTASSVQNTEDSATQLDTILKSPGEILKNLTQVLSAHSTRTRA